MVSGEGAEDNARFYLNESGELIPTRYFDYETEIPTRSEPCE